VAIILVNHVGLWSARWAAEGRRDWPFLVLLAFLFLPIIYYTQAKLLFPPEGGQQDLTEYFLDNRRPFFVLTILSYIASAFGPFVFYGRGSSIGVGMISWLVLIIVSVVLLYSRSERVHVICAAFILLAALGSYGVIDVG
jgi:hypothetical protein